MPVFCGEVGLSSTRQRVRHYTVRATEEEKDFDWCLKCNPKTLRHFVFATRCVSAFGAMNDSYCEHAAWCRMRNFQMDVNCHKPDELLKTVQLQNERIQQVCSSIS